MPFRLPSAMLAGCVFLPRFTDKVRAHRAGTLPADFQIAFGHPRGMDGHFFAHFAFEKDLTVAAVGAATDDEAVGAWFLAQPRVNAETIAAWNTLAPTIGRPGQPGHRELRWMLRRIFGSEAAIPPQITSSFEAIAWDECPEIRGGLA